MCTKVFQHILKILLLKWYDNYIQDINFISTPKKLKACEEGLFIAG